MRVIHGRQRGTGDGGWRMEDGGWGNGKGLLTSQLSPHEPCSGISVWNSTKTAKTNEEKAEETRNDAFRVLELFKWWK